LFLVPGCRIQIDVSSRPPLSTAPLSRPAIEIRGCAMSVRPPQVGALLLRPRRSWGFGGQASAVVVPKARPTLLSERDIQTQSPGRCSVSPATPGPQAPWPSVHLLTAPPDAIPFPVPPPEGAFRPQVWLRLSCISRHTGASGERLEGPAPKPPAFRLRVVGRDHSPLTLWYIAYRRFVDLPDQKSC
jgi:hypothetical protein